MKPIGVSPKNVRNTASPMCMTSDAIAGGRLKSSGSWGLSIQGWKQKKGEGIDYIARPYPFEIHVDDKEHTAAVSNLCLGYLFPDNQKETYDRLAEDFKYFCGSLGPDEMNYFASLYGMSEAEKGFIFWGDRNRVNEREGYEEVRKEQDALFNGTMMQRKTADLTPDFKHSVNQLKK